jgi:hypothetical protein
MAVPTLKVPRPAQDIPPLREGDRIHRMVPHSVSDGAIVLNEKTHTGHHAVPDTRIIARTAEAQRHRGELFAALRLCGWLNRPASQTSCGSGRRASTWSSARTGQADAAQGVATARMRSA